MLIRRMHKVVLVNQNMSLEMKRLLEFFPESVFITKKDRDGKQGIWRNKHFQQNIYDVKKYIEDLENINVQISDSDGERLMHSNSHTIISLYDFIQEQEGQTNEEICYTHCNIQIE